MTNYAKSRPTQYDLVEAKLTPTKDSGTMVAVGLDQVRNSIKAAGSEYSTGKLRMTVKKYTVAR